MCAYNHRSERRELWENLTRGMVVCTGAWIVSGEFSLVLDLKDRLGGNPLIVAEVVAFKENVEACEIIELPHHGNMYT